MRFIGECNHLGGARRLRTQIAPNILQPINKAVAADWHQACIGMALHRITGRRQDHDNYKLTQYSSAAAGFRDESGTAKRNAATGGRAALGGADRQVPAAHRTVRDRRAPGSRQSAAGWPRGASERTGAANSQPTNTDQYLPRQGDLV